jgi:hypothetical protein
MNTTGDEEARAALVRLLGSADRNVAATRALSVAVRMPKDPSPSVQRAWRERLEGSEHSGAVALVRGAGNRRGVIERARLVNADRLARDLGIVRAGERAATAVAVAREACDGREGMEAAVEAAARKWERGEDWCRLPADPDLVRTAFAAAGGLFDVAFGTHFRAASAQAAGSSKFLERHGATVCAILRHALELPPEMGQNEIWEMLGLVRFRHPVCLRAPVSFADRAGVSVPGSAVPWSAVNPDIVESCRPSGSEPTFVVTVENWTSFNGQCGDIPRGAVVYTSGFPPPPVRQLVNRMASIWPNIPFFHWGDVDAGGLLIADSIRNAAGKTVKLHLMTPELAEHYGQKHRPLTRIAGIAVRDDDFGRLAGYLSGEDCRVFEQEKLRPTDPMGTAQ